MASLNCLKNALYFSGPFCSAKRNGLTRSTMVSATPSSDFMMAMVSLMKSSSGMARSSAAWPAPISPVRDDFDHLQFGGSELVAQRLAVGMDGCLCGAIGWRDGHRQECESGGDGEDCTVPLF